MRTTIYNKVKRVAMLALLGAAMAPTAQAQEALHLFYKNGAREQLPITEDTYVEFVRQPYLEASWNGTDTIHLSASSGRSWELGYIIHNTGFEVSTANDWLLARKGNTNNQLGDGMHHDYFVVYPTANASDQPRFGKVTITSKKGELTKEFIVMQHPYMLTLTHDHFYGNYEVPVTSKTDVVAWNDTTYYAIAYPNHGVNILSHPKWMELTYKVDGDNYCQFEDILEVESAQSAGQSNETYARFRFEENRTPNSRTGNIIFEANGETAVLTVVQEGLTDATALAPIEDLQLWMITADDHDQFGHMAIAHATDMMSEDMTMFNSNWFIHDYNQAYNSAKYVRNYHIWKTYYGIVSRANAVIDLANDVKNEVSNENFVLGNAYAYRAMAYLYLIQLFQDPTSEYGINETLPGVPMLYSALEQKEMSAEQIEYFKGRNTVGEVFAQIEADITRAIELLQGEVRPSKNYIDVTVAQGIAARYYLLAQEWEKAATMANAARNTYRLMDGNTETNGIRDGFMDITNEEWMWGFDHTPETQTTYASFFSHISNLTPGYSGMGYTGRGVDARLLSQMSTSDYRRAYWYRDENGNTESTAAASSAAYMWEYPYAILKFGWKEDWTQDYIYMRAAEMILIEAEAWAHLGNISDAAYTFAELMYRRDPSWRVHQLDLEEIYLQRRLELIGEGHAYFDLKRLNKGIERDYEGSNHLDGYKLNVAAEDTVWTYKIPQAAINDDRTYNLTEEDNLWREPVYLKEIQYSSFNNDTIFMTASAGRTYSYGWVQCNYPWTVTADVDWLMARVNEEDIYDDLFTSGLPYENVFMVYAAANETGKERVGHVTIATEQDVKKTFTVVQRPYILTFNLEEYRNGVRYDGEPMDTFALEGTWDWNYAYYDLLPNFGWEVTSYPDWMTLEEVMHGAGTCSFEAIAQTQNIFEAGSSTLSTAAFRFEPNESPEPRTGYIIFEGNGQKAVGILHQEGLNEQSIINSANVLAKQMYQFGEAVGTDQHRDFGFPALMLAMDSRGTDLVSEVIGYNWFSGSVNYSDLGSNLVYTAQYWTTMYNQIQTANEVIRAYSERNEESLFQFYLGQAHAFRAFNYFYLAQLYQQTYVGNEEELCVPIIWENNMDMVNTQGCPRAKVRKVYEFILNDLDKAQQLLEATAVVAPSKRFVSPVAVSGLRARIYMVMNRWEEAAAEAQRVIDANVASPYTMDEVSRPTFADINHGAWLWGIDTEETDRVVTTGLVNWPSHMGSLNYGYASVGAWRKVNKALYEAIPATDVRKGWFLDENANSANLTQEQANYVLKNNIPAYTQMKFAPYKDEVYTSTNANDIPLLRIEEIYLILAEAKAMMGDVDGGAATLNGFVSGYRDAAYNCTASTTEELVEEVWMQRRIELWGEGHSYFDLMRMKKGVDRRGAGFAAEYVFDIPAGDAALIFPIPDREMNRNQQLIQNPMAEQPIAVEDITGREWLSTGTYVYTNFFQGTDPRLNLYRDLNNENTYIIENWLTGIDFTFVWDGDAAVYVPNQNTGYPHSLGDVYVMSVDEYAGQEIAPSYYDAETRTFYFGVVYYLEGEGVFGYGYETFILDETRAVARDENRTNHPQPAKAVSLEQLQTLKFKPIAQEYLEVK